MEEFVVYILFSEKYTKNYVGFTSNLIQRFKSHNSLGIQGYTRKFRPWFLLSQEFFNCKSDGIKMGKYLMSYLKRKKPVKRALQV
jgi:putative endonuclease